MDYVYSSTIYVCSRDGNLDGAFPEVSPSSDWGVLTPYENDIICSEYGGCAIPFYECTFSILGLDIPFTTFETEVSKHLVMVVSQLHPTSWAYVKVFKYLS